MTIFEALLSEFSYPPPTEAGCSRFALPLVVREQVFWR